MTDWRDKAIKVLELCKAEFRYMSMDKDGTWWIFATEPSPHDNLNVWQEDLTRDDTKHDYVDCFDIPTAPDWKTSLIKRGEL